MLINRKTVFDWLQLKNSEGSKRFVKDFLPFLAVAFLLYLGLMAGKLTNQYDGMWWVGGYFQASQSEASTGRWLNVVMDWLERGHADDPYSSYLALIILAVANVFLVDIFRLREKKQGHLVNALICSGVTICVWLSYRFMSSIFTFSYLAGVLAAWFVVKVKRPIPAIILSAVAICCALGSYQSSIGCTCLVMVAAFLVECCESKKIQEQLLFIVRCLGGIVGGCILYKVVWDVVLKVTGIQAASYGGADSLSLADMIIEAPIRIVNTYWTFYKYFLTDEIRYSVLQGTPLLRPLLAFIMLAIIWKGLPLIRKNIITAALYFGAMACLPIACDFCLLLQGDTTLKPQMTAPFMMFVPVMLCVVFQLDDVKPLLKSCLDKAAIVVAILFLWGNIYAIGTDMQVMYQGRKSSEAVVGRIVDELIDEGLYDPEQRYVFIGTPSESPLFYKSLLWDKANHYAQYGDFWIPSDTIRRSYEGIMIEMGLNLKVGNNEQIEAYNAQDYHDPMPVFPAEGSIRQMDDCVVIKVSENYLSYCE